MRIREKHVGRVSKRLFFSRDEKKKITYGFFLERFLLSREKERQTHTHKSSKRFFALRVYA